MYFLYNLHNLSIMSAFYVQFQNQVLIDFRIDNKQQKEIYQEKFNIWILIFTRRWWDSYLDEVKYIHIKSFYVAALFILILNDIWHIFYSFVYHWNNSKNILLLLLLLYEWKFSAIIHLICLICAIITNDYSIYENCIVWTITLLFIYTASFKN